MSITIPSELQWLGWIAGSDWPDGDEDKMWAIAADWRQAAADIRALLPDLAAARKATIEAYPWGDGVEEMTAALDKLDRGPESLEQLAEILDYVVESADALGTEIEYTKILVISSLAMLAFEIAAAWFFPPTAPLVEAAAIGVTRVAVRLLGQRAVSAIARFAAKTGLAALAKFTAKHVVFSTVLGAGQDAAIQAYQVGAGHRDGIDWNRVGTTAYTAAAAGAVGGPVGGLLGKAATKVPLPAGRWSGALKGAAVGAGSGMVGALGAWGVGGFANGWTWDPRLLTGGAAYGVLTGGSKGFRHAPSGRGPGARGFNAPTPGRFGGDGSSARVHPTGGADAQNGAGNGSTHRSGDSSANGAGNRDVSTGNHPGETSNQSGNQAESSSNTNSGGRNGESRAGMPGRGTHEVTPAHTGNNESGIIAGPKESQATAPSGQGGDGSGSSTHGRQEAGTPTAESQHAVDPTGRANEGANSIAPQEEGARSAPAQQHPEATSGEPRTTASGEDGAPPEHASTGGGEIKSPAQVKESQDSALNGQGGDGSGSSTRGGQEAGTPTTGSQHAVEQTGRADEGANSVAPQEEGAQPTPVQQQSEAPAGEPHAAASSEKGAPPEQASPVDGETKSPAQEAGGPTNAGGENPAGAPRQSDAEIANGTNPAPATAHPSDPTQASSGTQPHPAPAGGDGGQPRSAVGGDGSQSKPTVGNDGGQSRSGVGGDGGQSRSGVGGDGGQSRSGVGGDGGQSRSGVG
ncbi:WXG100-like domain-containing protein, partial [Nocardia colli]|uniref:WXG100-like domain-containing protein n=1 Tax=Nocardia colli TaxID=2545717 RepID=UPI00406360E0